MSEPSATSTSASGTAPKASSESEFLDQQARDAKAAISAALADAKAALAQGVDPVTWARRYPVIAIGSALVAGFAAATMAIPSRNQQELRRIEKIARALHPAPPKPAAAKQEKTEESTANGSSFWGTVLKESLAFARPLMAALVSSHLGGQAPPPNGQDGHVEAAPPPAASAPFPRR